MPSTKPRTKADLTPGAVYGIDGGEGWWYFGQLAADKSVGFFKFRSRTAEDAEVAITCPVMCRFGVAYPSIGRALRRGKWKHLGRRPTHGELGDYRPYASWPHGSERVDVFTFAADGSWTTSTADIADPAIQQLEVAAAWDAEHHVPGRLKTDFGAERGEWHIGGPVWRERQVAVEYGRRFPDAPHHVARAKQAGLS